MRVAHQQYARIRRLLGTPEHCAVIPRAFNAQILRAAGKFDLRIRSVDDLGCGDIEALGKASGLTCQNTRRDKDAHCRNACPQRWEPRLEPHMAKRLLDIALGDDRKHNAEPDQ